MHNKINIFAEEDALVRLGANNEFKNGRLLKYILQNRANIFLIMDKEKFNAAWTDPESRLRKFCQAYDLSKPCCKTELTQIYKRPALCYQLDPYAIWLFNRSDSEVNKFRNYLGVWAINPSKLTDNFFYLHHTKLKISTYFHMQCNFYKDRELQSDFLFSFCLFLSHNFQIVLLFH